MGETIRVQGKYDHKTLLDVDKSKTSDRSQTWDIRVATVDRTLPSSGRNPNADSAASDAHPKARTAPADRRDDRDTEGQRGLEDPSRDRPEARDRGAK